MTIALTFGIDLAAVKAFLGYDVLDTSRDPILTALLDASVKELRVITGRNLYYGAYRDTFTFFAQKTYLREWPVSLLFAVKTDNTEVPSLDFKMFGATGLLHFHQHRLGSRFFDSGQYCYVDYVGGYATLPADMYLAVMSAVQAADNAQKQSLNYGGAVKKLTVYDVGVTDFGAVSTSMSIIKDIMNAQLGQYTAVGFSMGTPNLHESEFLGDASLFSPSEALV